MPVELALRGLYDALCSALAFFRSYEEAFGGRVGQLASWVPDATLDELWRNMVQDRFRDKAQAEKFADAGERIAERLRPVRRVAAARAPRVAVVGTRERYALERRIRAARKAVVHGEGIIDLVRRAEGERVGCEFLVEELRDAVGLLDPTTHPHLYQDEGCAENGQGPAQDGGQGDGGGGFGIGDGPNLNDLAQDNRGVGE